MFVLSLYLTRYPFFGTVTLVISTFVVCIFKEKLAYGTSPLSYIAATSLSYSVFVYGVTGVPVLFRNLSYRGSLRH